MRKIKKHRFFEKGYTFIELLIVVVVIGILAVIAVTQFATYRQRAVKSGMQQDARTVATVLEAYHADHSTYPDFTANFEDPYVIDSQIVRASPNNFIVVQGGSASYLIIVNNPGGGEGSQNCSLTSQGAIGWY